MATCPYVGSTILAPSSRKRALLTHLYSASTLSRAWLRTHLWAVLLPQYQQPPARQRKRPLIGCISLNASPHAFRNTPSPRPLPPRQPIPRFSAGKRDGPHGFLRTRASPRAQRYTERDGFENEATAPKIVSALRHIQRRLLLYSLHRSVGRRPSWLGAKANVTNARCYNDGSSTGTLSSGRVLTPPPLGLHSSLHLLREPPAFLGSIMICLPIALPLHVDPRNDASYAAFTADRKCSGACLRSNEVAS